MPFPNQELTELSPAGHKVLNKIGIISYNGAEIAALLASGPTNGQVVYCNSSLGDYEVGHWYGYFEDINAFIDLNGYPDFLNFQDVNRHRGIIDKRFAPREMWHYNSSGTGAGVNNNNTDGTIELVTGNTSTGWAELKIGGPQLLYSAPAWFICKFKIPSQISGSIVKVGVNMDRAGTGPTTNRQFGMEYCDGDTDWQIHTATGSAQSNKDLGANFTVSAGATKSFYIYFDPGNSVYVEDENGNSDSKVTDIPSSSVGSASDLMKISISNNNGDTTSKTLTVTSAYLVYEIGDSNWVYP